MKGSKIENIIVKMTVELIYYLVNGEADLTTGAALKLLCNYDQKIRNAAHEMYNAYEHDDELDLLEDPLGDWLREYLREIHLQLDIDTNVEMYQRIRKISKDMYREYVNKYGFPNDVNSSVKREYFRNVDYNITGCKLSGENDESRLIEAFKFTLENLRSAQKIMSEEDFKRST